jgi:preprotein translocase subunit SecD
MMSHAHFIVALGFGLCSVLSQVASAASASEDAVSEDVVTVEFYIAESSAAAGLKQAKVEGRNDDLVYLHETPVLTREDIAEAHVIMDKNNQPAIDIAFTKAGQAKIGKATQENIGKRLAIVVNGKVISAPRVGSTIAEHAQISGVFSKAEAEKLAQTMCPPGQESR